MNDEDFWLQIHVTGDDQIESVTLFNYLSYVTVNSDAELQRLAGPNSLIGLPAYNHDGVEYIREWGTEQGQTELVPMTEHVVNPDESYTIEPSLDALRARDRPDRSPRIAAVLRRTGRRRHRQPEHLAGHLAVHD